MSAVVETVASVLANRDHDSKFETMFSVRFDGKSKVNLSSPTDAIEKYLSAEFFGELQKYLPKLNIKFPHLNKEQSKIKFLERYCYVLITMWSNPRKHKSDYWKNPDCSVFGGSRIIPKLLYRDKYDLFHKKVSFQKQQIHDFISWMNKYFGKLYLKSSHIAIDEILLFFSGANPFKVCIKAKPAGIGFKFYASADSNGFITNFFLYHKKKFNEETKGMCYKTTLIQRTITKYVLKLLNDMPDPKTELTLVCDGFFGSLELANILNSQGMRFVLAINKKERGMSKVLRSLDQVELTKGEWCYSGKNRDKMLALKWVDKKELYFVTNCFGGEPTQTKFREIPQVVAAYNLLMNFADKAD